LGLFLTGVVLDGELDELGFGGLDYDDCFTAPIVPATWTNAGEYGDNFVFTGGQISNVEALHAPADECGQLAFGV
jgi:hypothetical protein